MDRPTVPGRASRGVSAVWPECSPGWTWWAHPPDPARQWRRHIVDAHPDRVLRGPSPSGCRCATNRVRARRSDYFVREYATPRRFPGTTSDDIVRLAGRPRTGWGSHPGGAYAAAPPGARGAALGPTGGVAAAPARSDG